MMLPVFEFTELSHIDQLHLEDFSCFVSPLQRVQHGMYPFLSSSARRQQRQSKELDLFLWKMGIKCGLA